MAPFHGGDKQQLELAIQRDLSVLVELAGDYEGGLVLYVFGSSAQQAKEPHDIDILAIYEKDDSIRKFRNQTAGVAFTRPLHLIAMTRAEEAFYGFIKCTNAKRITELRQNHLAHQ